jgi:hypothetical protein
MASGRRAMVVGDSVCIRAEFVANLSSKFDTPTFSVAPHVPMLITDAEAIKGRRLLHLGGGRMRVWPCEVRLATGRVELDERKAAAHVAKMTRAKAIREAARRLPKRKATP